MSNVENQTVDPNAANTAKAKKRNAKPKIATVAGNANVARLEPIAEGEKAQRTVTHVKDGVVRALFSVSPSKTDHRRFQMDQTFDFTNCSQAEMIEMALSTVVIAWQSVFRSMPDAERLNADNWKSVVDVKRDILSRQRAPRSGKSSEIRSMMNDLGLNEDDIIQMLQERVAKNGAPQ